MSETLAEAANRQFGFNPGQLRGPDGKWIHVGSAVKHAELGTGVVTEKHHLGKVSVRFDRKGLKKVSEKDLTPSTRPNDDIDEELLHKRTLKKEAEDRADEEAAHRRQKKKEAQDRADEEAAHRRNKARGR